MLESRAVQKMESQVEKIANNVQKRANVVEIH